MLHFLRQIRQKLIIQDNVRKYMLYAIGEILLVMIGILIALQINNWNEARVEKHQEELILRNLHAEFSQNLEELNYDIKRVDSLEDALTDIIAMIDNGPGVTEELDFDKLLSTAITSPTWNPSSYVLNDLRNSGGLSKLSNPELIRLLFSWDRHFENMTESMENIKFSSRALLIYIQEYGSLRNADSQTVDFLGRSKLPVSNLSLLKDIRFENVVDDQFFVTHYLKGDYLESRTKIKQILEAIE